MNKEISVYLGFSGNSFELIKEENEYYVKRLILGSGLPVIGEVIYKIKKSNKNSIIFNELKFEIDQSNREIIGENDDFEISFVNNKIHIFIHSCPR
jgi:hypothetical protein